MANETTESLRLYFKSLRKLEPLTVAEEQELADLIRAGDQEAIHKLVKHNLRLVIIIAKRHIGQGVPLDDLIQEGNIGLYEAAKRYDPKGADRRFSSFAQFWIRKRVNEIVAKHGRIVRLPHNQEYQIFKDKRAGLEVSVPIRVETDAPYGEDGDATIGDRLLRNEPDVELSIEMQAARETAIRLLGLIDRPRDRQIVCEYFGIGRDGEVPTSVIAERHGIHQVRACQIIKAALQKMKAESNTVKE